MSIINFNEVYTLPDGMTVTFKPAPGTPEAIEYDENGYSLEMRHGCVRNKGVDAWLDSLKDGDEFDQEAEKRLPRWFSLMLPDRVYTEEEIDVIVKNFQQMYSLTTLHLARFYPEIKGKSDKGESLAGYGVPIKGFALDKLYLRFADTFIGTMKLAIKRARVKADPNGFDFRNYKR